MIIHRSEFLKEKSRSKATHSTINAKPSSTFSQTVNSAIAAGSSSSSPFQEEPPPEPSSLPQIKPYVRKRPRDTSDGIPSISPKVSVLSSNSTGVVEGGGGGREHGEIATIDVDSAGVSLQVKPYVRKRKIRHK